MLPIAKYGASGTSSFLCLLNNMETRVDSNNPITIASKASVNPK